MLELLQLSALASNQGCCRPALATAARACAAAGRGAGGDLPFVAMCTVCTKTRGTRASQSWQRWKLGLKYLLLSRNNLSEGLSAVARWRAGKVDCLSNTGKKRLDLSCYFRERKKETFRSIFHTSGRNLETDRDEQKAYVFLCIFPCWEITFTVAT